MIISGKRVRNIDKYLPEFQEGESLYIGIQNADEYSTVLRKYGLLGDFSATQTFLPRPLRHITSFNANGIWIPDKSLPMEARTFESEYHIVDWHGNDHYGTRYYSRNCYQRRFIHPPEIELTYSNRLLISPLLEYSQSNKKLITHVVNMFLEMFGKCETLTKDKCPKIAIRTDRLTWTVLPKGEYPWEKAKEHLDAVIKTIPSKHRVVISKRHETITKNIPDFMAVGDQGFWGYVIYGFSKKGIFIFESNQPNNATYIFSGNWKEASQLTKSEILNGKIHEARIIHNEKWNESINALIR